MSISDIVDKVKANRINNLELSISVINIGRDLNIIYNLEDICPFVLRIYSDDGGKKEYKILKEVSRVLLDHVASPIELIEYYNETATIVTYLKHNKIEITNINRSPIADQLKTVLIALDKLKKEAINEEDVNREIDYKDICKTAQKYFNNIFGKYLEIIVPISLEKIGKVRQHSDFTISNVGLCNNKLIVLDWEDYGKIRYPGFDLATILESVLYHANEINIITCSPVRLSQFVDDYIGVDIYTKTGVGKELFMVLFPFYMLCYLYIRDEVNSDDSICERIRGIIEEMMGNINWQNIMKRG